MSEPRVQITGRLIFGLVVITFGTLLMLDNLDLVNADEVLRFWPVAILAYGLARLTGIGSRQNLTAGLIFTLVGGWMLLHRLDVITLSPWELWPLALVLIGASMVLGSLRRGRGGEGPPRNATDTLSAFALWSGTDRRVESQDFRGGDITAIMGGHDIDLRGAKIAPGGQAVIDLMVWMGGVDLIVPDDWRISAESLVLMGAVEDHTRRPESEAHATLVLRGLVLMGGVDIKNKA